jgi:hypothetical protein
MDELRTEALIGVRNGVADFSAEGAPRLGHLLAADYLVDGTLMISADGRLRLSALAYDVDSGESVGSASPDSSRGVSTVFRAQKLLTLEILDVLGVEVSSAERKRIWKYSTENLDAFVAYCEGLEAEDRGDLATARAAYARAVQADEDFSVARDRMDTVEAAASATSIAPIASNYAGESVAASTGTPGLLSDRIGTTDVHLGYGGDGTGLAQDPTPTAPVKIDPGVMTSVVITGQLPSPPIRPRP